MKRIWIVFALLILLCGCDRTEPGQTESVPVQTTESPTETVTVPTVEEPGLYVPHSDVEQQTGGAVRAYRVSGENVMDVTAAGEHLIVFSSCDAGMRATMLSGDNCVVKAQALLPGCMGTDTGVFRALPDRMAYYDGNSRSVVVLDAALKEINRILLPDQTTGDPVISEDLTTIFYCIDDKIHALDMATGISRLIRQHSCQWQTLQRSFFDDTILQCQVTDEDMQIRTCFLSTTTGQLLGQDEALWKFDAFGDRFFLVREEGALPEYLFGDERGQLQALLPQETSVYSALSMNAVVGTQSFQDSTAVLLYDLQSGRCTATVELTGIQGVYDVTADSTGRYIWISVYDWEAQRDMLYRWDPTQSPAEGEQVYTQKRFTREAPDVQGIAECKAQAQALGEKYGVQILVGEDIVAPWDYTLTTEYRAEVMELGLQQLEKALSVYSEGFLTAMVEDTASEVIRISLVRDISGDVDGLQYWIDGDAYIALKISDALVQDLYHEVSHVLDNYIIANCYAYDDWEKLNPEGAVYDYNYTDYRSRTDWTWLEGDNKAFIDSYSMTYPKEDRARILEYAMTPGNEDLFQSEYLQSKLLKICEGIRESFDYERYEGTFLWEQYLETSLAYTKKK